MAGTAFYNTAPTVVEAAEIIGAAHEPVELTRGNDQVLLEHLTPLVCRESVVLDLTSVERIDAAGLAVLITLYCDACKAGHQFTVSGPNRHVREVLSIVGLDRILLPSGSTPPGAMRPSVQQTAA